MLALLALTVDESDEAFANVYSGAVSLQNLLPRVPQRLLVAGVAAVATVGALLIDLRNYQPFLYLLGSFFVPLFAVLLADWLLAGRHYEPRRRLPRAGGPGRDGRRVARRLLPLPVALSAGPCAGGRSLVAHAHPHALPWGGASLAELRRRVRARCGRAAARKEAYPRERVIALHREPLA